MKGIRSLTAIAFGSALLLAPAFPAFADPDPLQGHERLEKERQKAHQKNENVYLKEHQREERGIYGNSAAIRVHERLERERLKQHEQAEKRNLKAHQRRER